MNKRMIAYMTGVVLLIEAGLMLPSAVVAVIYREWRPLMAFGVTIGIVALVGLLLTRANPRSKTIYSREGLLTVALAWIALSLGGALPFIISGEIPQFINAFFETVSGFTTTGASILNDVEALSNSILFWRSFTHWIGGMGVLVFVMATVPLAGGGGNIHILRAESPGPEVSKLVPSTKGTAMRLYAIYLAMTVLEILLLIIVGVPVFDSMTLSFGTAGTGGFAILNTSCATYSAAAQTIITVFMAAFGVNFTCYYLLLMRRWKGVFKNEELRAYLIIMAAAIAIITVNTLGSYASFGETLRAAAFQVASVMTTTGFSTVDFNVWPELSRMLMLLVMCVGACVGSTGGGIKVARVVILFKEGRRQLHRAIRPNRMETVRFNGKPVNTDMISSICGFFVLYMAVFVISLIIISIDTKDIVSNISGVIATLNNIGPGLEVVGAAGNYSTYSALSKSVFIADMLLGRLELIPVLAIFSRRTWKAI